MTNQVPQRTFLGHPLGLYVLFFTEMWERFSYYGMRALLMLYMVNYFKFQQSEASAIYKWYTSLVYLTPLLGGFLADRYLGNKWAVIIGASLMAVGHFLMAFEDFPIFIAALIFLIFGNGFFKPNMSTQVGRLYPKNDPRRDGAYTIFYMGINLGAFLAPLLCGWLSENTRGQHHTGFTMAGIGMVLGLVIYLFGLPLIREVAEEPALVPPTVQPGATTAVVASPSTVLTEAQAEKTPSAAIFFNVIAPGFFLLAAGLLATVVACLTLLRVSAHYLSTTPLKDWTFTKYISNDNLIALGIVTVCALISAWIISRVRNAVRDRVITIFALGLFVIFFWAAFEQAGNALNLWADKSTQRYLTQEAPAVSKYPAVQTPAAQSTNAAGERSAPESFWMRWITMWQVKQAEQPAQGENAPVTSSGWFSQFWNPVPTAWFQSINALAIFVLAPLFAALWTWLDRKHLNPSVPLKMCIGLLFMGLAFVFMMGAAQAENKPTQVAFAGQLPTGVRLTEKQQLAFNSDKQAVPADIYHSGRLIYDAEGGLLKMTGVLPDTERDRIVRDTAPTLFVEELTELQKQLAEMQKQQGQLPESHAQKLKHVPAGFDFRYTGFHESKVAYDPNTQTLTVKNYLLADKDVKAILVAAGEPALRTALDELYVSSQKYRVSSMWLFWCYMMATLGELCLSPVGLSMVSKLAPTRYATMLMGLWLLTSFFGHFAAGAFGESWGIETPFYYFTLPVVILGIGTLLLLVLVPLVRKMMHGVK